jgi:hypothetical protein
MDTTAQPQKPILEIRDNIRERIRRRKLIRWGVIFFIFLFCTLPFHYVPSHFRIFTKENLTFSNTFILQSDITQMVNRYNDASLMEKISIANEPLYRKLKEKAIIYLQNEIQPKPNNSYTNSVGSDSYQFPEDNTSTPSKTSELIQQERYSLEDQKIIDKLKAKAKRDWPNDYSVQKMVFEEQVQNYFYMKTVTDLKIKRKVQTDWPLGYSVQKMIYNEEIDAKEQMK